MAKRKKRKKSGNKPKSVEKIVLVTAILKLISVVIDLIKKLLE